MESPKLNCRNSSLELLRIICIIMIIFYHYAVHGGYGVVTYQSLNLGRTFIHLIGMFGRMACSVFVLISGFFLITSDKKNIIEELFR